MGKLNIGLFIIFFCFAIVTTCHCLDVKMPKNDLVVAFFPYSSPFLLTAASAFAGHVTVCPGQSQGLCEETGLHPCKV